MTDTRGSIELRPASVPQADSGLIFIPGGFVDPAAYIEALAPLARAGYPVLIRKVPANLAVLDPQGADRLRQAIPEISTWAIGGHSLGGVMAASLIGEKPQNFQALILMASYPAAPSDLSAWEGSVLSIAAEFDGLTKAEDIDAGRPRLPDDSQYSLISGGCHAYFGSYGPQDGDGIPSISREEQQAQVAALIIDILSNL